MPADIAGLRATVLLQSLRMALSLRRAEITASLLEKHGHAVLDGPFCGMTLLDETSWSDGDLAPKLLGCYEEELHKTITTAAGRNPKVIVNVGCAEGLYAVGLARLVPQARIFAFDTDPTAQAICRRAAERNGVADRTIVGAACSIEALRNVITSATGTVLLFVDCEGAELALLDPTQLPELRICDIIVECHDFISRTITPTLVQRLSNTHHVENIVEGPRNPNRFVSLRQLGSSDRWLAMDEGRPQTMNWLACWSRRS